MKKTKRGKWKRKGKEKEKEKEKGGIEKERKGKRLTRITDWMYSSSISLGDPPFSFSPPDFFSFFSLFSFFSFLDHRMRFFSFRPTSMARSDSIRWSWYLRISSFSFRIQSFLSSADSADIKKHRALLLDFWICWSSKELAQSSAKISINLVWCSGTLVCSVKQFFLRLHSSRNSSLLGLPNKMMSERRNITTRIDLYFWYGLWMVTTPCFKNSRDRDWIKFYVLIG